MMSTESSSAESPIPVLVVDDQESFRLAMREVVDGTEGFMLVGEASSGEAALEAAERLAPRMVIIDKRMPGMDGLEATRILKTRHPRLVVLLVSVEEPETQLMRSCGADAFVRKQHLRGDLLRATWRAHGT